MFNTFEQQTNWNSKFTEVWSTVFYLEVGERSKTKSSYGIIGKTLPKIHVAISYIPKIEEKWPSFKLRLKCYYAFFLVCCGCDTSYIVSVHIQCQASIYTLSLCRGHSWRVRLAKQETLTPPGHLVSPLVCRGPWMSTVVLYCWCHSDSASVLLYFTFLRDGQTIT